MTGLHALLRSSAFVCLGCTATITAAYGSIIEFKQLTVDFTNPADAAGKAHWSEPQNIDITANGLGWDGESASSREGWIRSKPMAVGYSWRTASYVSARVSVSPAPKEILLSGGQKHTPYFGSVFVRYSPDRQHWSSWQMLQPAEPTERDNPQSPSQHFQLSISVPQQERAGYSKLLSEYAQLDVPWKSDEDAAVRWIVKRDPGFFARQIPLIGYLEFLVETHFYGGQRIQSLNAAISFSMGGMHLPPKDPNDPNYRNGHRVPWKFVAAKSPGAATEPAGN